MKNSEINIRDPFVLNYDGKYYLYGTRGATCWGLADGFDVYVGTDLENWSEPIEIFHKTDDFWADRNYWAPEVHYYNGAFYLFASFKSDNRCRGTQILKSDSPTGPFKLHSDGPVTPKDWECLDGTFYVSKEGTPYMVFCHEWVQVRDGEICCIELTRDLKASVGQPKLLFKASEAPWIVSIKHSSSTDTVNYVTDGPFLYRSKSGSLIMLWSSFGEEGYTEAIAVSDNGEISGNWSQQPRLLFKKDGGHGMLFKSLEGRLMLTLHSPNERLKENPAFYEIDEEEGELFVKNPEQTK